ncbi:MAG: hypothetical protein WDO56_29675 [Gammaproteobacteria bacterium]
MRDNLLGSVEFCPQVFCTPETTAALELNVGECIARIEGQFSAELVMRSAIWLTIKESRSSFAIEHEEDKVDRIRRFAIVMEQRVDVPSTP